MRKDRAWCCVNNKLPFALVEGSSQCLVEHSIVGGREGAIPSLCRIIAWRHIILGRDTSHQQVPPRRAIPGSCPRSLSLHRGLSIMYCCETHRHSINTMPPSPSLVLRLQPVESLSLSSEGPLPPPGLPTKRPHCILYLVSLDCSGSLGLQFFEER